MLYIAERGRLGVDPASSLIAGIERRRRQVGHRGQIPREALADRLGLATQDIRLALEAMTFQIIVERVPGREPRDRDHEVATGIADQALRNGER